MTDFAAHSTAADDHVDQVNNTERLGRIEKNLSTLTKIVTGNGDPKEGIISRIAAIESINKHLLAAVWIAIALGVVKILLDL